MHPGSRGVALNLDTGAGEPRIAANAIGARMMPPSGGPCRTVAIWETNGRCAIPATGTSH